MSKHSANALRLLQTATCLLLVRVDLSIGSNTVLPACKPAGHSEYHAGLAVLLALLATPKTANHLALCLCSIRLCTALNACRLQHAADPLLALELARFGWRQLLRLCAGLIPSLGPLGATVTWGHVRDDRGALVQWLEVFAPLLAVGSRRQLTGRLQKASTICQKASLQCCKVAAKPQDALIHEVT